MKQTILVVEDQLEVRENLIETLELADYIVYGAADGHEGVRLVREHLPQLILCDVMMPKLDGYGVLELLQADENTRHIPLVFLTAKAEREDLRRGMNLGAADYVIKPFYQDELLRVVQQRILPIGNNASSTESTNPFPRTALTEILASVQEKGRERSFSDRAIIYFAGDSPQSFFRVVKGRVKLFSETSFGKCLTIDSIGAGGWFGLEDIVADSAHSFSAAAYPEATVTIVDRVELESVLRKHPNLYQWLASQFAQDLTLRAEQLLQIAYFSVRKRVAEFLLRSVKGLSVAGTHIDLRREDIAESVATTSESVTRVLTEFRKEGLVELPEHGGVVLLNEVGLQGVPA